MSCNCCKRKIVVNGVVVTATFVTLGTSTTLATTLASDVPVELIVDPSILPTNGLPVQLSDGTTTIPLTIPNGNVMRENIFKSLAERRKQCDCFSHLKCFYGNDSAHLLVHVPSFK